MTSKKQQRTNKVSQNFHGIDSCETCLFCRRESFYKKTHRCTLGGFLMNFPMSNICDRFETNKVNRKKK